MGVVISSSFLRSATFLLLTVSHLRIFYLVTGACRMVNLEASSSWQEMLAMVEHECPPSHISFIIMRVEIRLRWPRCNHPGNGPNDLLIVFCRDLLQDAPVHVSLPFGAASSRRHISWCQSIPCTELLQQDRLVRRFLLNSTQESMSPLPRCESALSSLFKFIEMGRHDIYQANKSGNI